MELTALPSLYVGIVIRQINLLKFIGMDVFNDSNNNSFNKYGRLTIYLSFLFCMIFGQVMYVIRGSSIGADFMDLVNAIPTVFVVTQVSVKISVFILKKHQIKEIIIEVGKEWPECSDEEKSKELFKCVQKLKRFENAFYRAAVFTLFLFTVSPIFITVYKFYTTTDAKYELILQVYYFYELNSTYKYAIVYFHQLITCLISNFCVYMSCDLILVDLMFALSSLLRLIQIDLRNMKLPSIKRSDELCNDVQKIVKKHQNVLRLSENLNKIFGPLIFMQVSISAIIISCHGFMAIVADGMFLRNVTSALGVTFSIFILAWPGQLLIDTSSAVAEAAYQSCWYDKSNQFKKYILIIITRSQRPCKLTALGFSDISLGMFSKVLSTSWSYLSLIRQIYQDFD